MKNILGNVSYCLECGNEIAYGRDGKKFCDCICKNKYHNRLRTVNQSAKKQTIGILDTNYEILSALIKAGIESVYLFQIERIGFRQGFNTGFKKLDSNTYLCMCYDIEYRFADSKIFAINKNISNFGLINENYFF